MQFISFDIETTGFLAGIDQITEIGAIKFENGVPTAVFSTLIDPQRAIPSEVTRITGITAEMVIGQPKIEDILPSFAEFCEASLLVAHNAPFDFQFITADIKKYETAAPRGAILDSCAMARKVFPGLLNYKLGTLVEHLKIESNGFHRAEGDASYCGQLFHATIEKLTVQGRPPTFESLVAVTGSQPLRFPQIIRQPKQLDMLGGLGL